MSNVLTDMENYFCLCLMLILCHPKMQMTMCTLYM